MSKHDFPVQFPLSEFIAKSGGPIGDIGVSNARYFANALLPSRLIFGRFLITSYYRPGDKRSHGRFAGLDIVPLDAPIEMVHAYIALESATHKMLFGSPRFGEILLELPSEGETTKHIHLTLPGVGGDGQVLTETRDGFKPFIHLDTLVFPIIMIILTTVVLNA